MSANFKAQLIKVQARRFAMPDQTGRKSPLRREVPIIEYDVELEPMIKSLNEEEQASFD